MDLKVYLRFKDLNSVLAKYRPALVDGEDGAEPEVVLPKLTKAKLFSKIMKRYPKTLIRVRSPIFDLCFVLRVFELAL